MYWVAAMCYDVLYLIQQIYYNHKPFITYCFSQSITPYHSQTNPFPLLWLIAISQLQLQFAAISHQLQSFVSITFLPYPSNLSPLRTLHHPILKPLVNLFYPVHHNYFLQWPSLYPLLCKQSCFLFVGIAFIANFPAQIKRKKNTFFRTVSIYCSSCQCKNLRLKPQTHSRFS